ncbi:hypothetical protein ACTFIT_006831 [Dictyostelium discoideum]
MIVALPPPQQAL